MKIVFKTNCRLMQVKVLQMLQGEHSAILLTFIKLRFVMKIFVLSFLGDRFTQVLLYSVVFIYSQPNTAHQSAYIHTNELRRKNPLILFHVNSNGAYPPANLLSLISVFVIYYLQLCALQNLNNHISLYS